ncbi:MAG: DUF3570 domain-containing protein [Gammaproteobacteria bacterium]|nr:DUF3570 domain-containing protein [Gammaproteobacteria bacterium]
MQLKKLNLSQVLAVATSSLLAGTSQTVLAVDNNNDWQVDSSVLFYSETDRVSVVEPVVSARKKIGDDEYLKFKLVADALTGASPNGAIKTSSAQTFTTPSGSSTYTTAANTAPLDPSFHDTRGALSAEWEKPLNERLKGVFSANYSQEFDYSSLGLGANFSWDVNQRNTTLTAGVGYSLDQVKPVGGMPTGLTAMPTTTSVSKSKLGDTDDKTIASLLLGVTQVIGPKHLLQLNYTYSNEDGYLTDPYKILSVLDNSGNLRGTNPYLYEKRPTTRTRHALYLKDVKQFGADVLQFSYRYAWDDWGILSHTLDLRYRYELNAKNYLEPHLRYYLQDKADFYYYNLVDGSIPQFASADYRLGDLSTKTIGLKYGYVFAENHEFGIRTELIQQQAEGSAQFPDTDAVLVQLNYSFTF